MAPFLRWKGKEKVCEGFINGFKFLKHGEIVMIC